MSNKKATTSNEAYLMEVILNTDENGKVNWNAVMTATGFTSEGGTRNKLGLLKKAYLATKDGDEPAASAPTTPKPGRKRKVDEEDGKAVKTPKTPKTPRTKKPKAEASTADDETVADVKDEVEEQD